MCHKKTAAKPVADNPPIMDIQNLSSAYDCTGLIPTGIANESEADSYARLFAIHRQKKNTFTTGEQVNAEETPSAPDSKDR